MKATRNPSVSAKIKRYGASVVLVAGLLGVGAGTALADSASSGLTLPPVDPSLTFVAPSADQPNYAARVDVFVQATVPDVWHGQAVQFLSAYNDAGGVDVLGMPISEPLADPANPNFVYQRFQNGVMFYNAAAGTTQVLG